jgi:hypothetical protein
VRWRNRSERDAERKRARRVPRVSWSEARQGLEREDTERSKRGERESKTKLEDEGGRGMEDKDGNKARRRTKSKGEIVSFRASFQFLVTAFLREIFSSRSFLTATSFSFQRSERW